jgi:small subunit ribosomal protein S9
MDEVFQRRAAGGVELWHPDSFFDRIGVSSAYLGRNLESRCQSTSVCQCKLATVSPCFYIDNMELGALRSGLRAAIASFRQPATRRFPISQSQFRRLASTTADTPLGDIRAAPPIDFANKDTAAAEEPAEDDDLEGGRSIAAYAAMMDRLRIVPASPSYFTGKPDFTDDLLKLENLQRKYQTLPVLPTGHAPRVAWKTLAQYKVNSNEPVKAARYTKILQVLQRLNYIHPNLMPEEVAAMLRRYMRDVQPFHNQPKPGVVDEYGRARGVGRRKSSNAVAFLVEGEGECLINGKPLTQAFGRLHDRESALWALKVTERMDKYNVWCVARGGGTTGQADAIALAVSKALMVHEPLLKPALRRGMLNSIDMLVWNRSANSILQLVSSQEILVVSRERSPESSRLARCLPGSSVDPCTTITFFPIHSVYLYKIHNVLFQSLPQTRHFFSKPYAEVSASAPAHTTFSLATSPTTLPPS